MNELEKKKLWNISKVHIFFNIDIGGVISNLRIQKFGNWTNGMKLARFCVWLFLCYTIPLLEYEEKYGKYNISTWLLILLPLKSPSFIHVEIYLNFHIETDISSIRTFLFLNFHPQFLMLFWVMGLKN